MIMGSCMAQYDISMVHLNNFHQAKWEEYRYEQIGIHGLVGSSRIWSIPYSVNFLFGESLVLKII